MRYLFKNTFSDFRDKYKDFLLFGLIYMVLTSFIFVPVFTFIFDRMLLAVDSSALLNNEIFKIGLSYTGMAGIIIIAVIAVIVIFIEFSVLIILSQKKYFNKHVLLSDSLITAVRKTPKIFGIGILHLMFFLLFLIPFLSLPSLSPALIESINLPLFIKNKIFSSSILLLVYVSMFLLIVYIFLRWIFALHYIVLENESVKKAISYSLELTKNNMIKILIKLFIFNVVVTGSGLLIISSITHIPLLIDLNNNYLVENFLLTLSGFLTFILTLLLTPVNMLFITRLYYDSKVDRGLEYKDNLTIYRSKFLNTVEKKARGFFYKKKYLVWMGITLIFLGTFFLNYTVNNDIIYLGRDVFVAGHRGDLHRAPENSLSSIKSALEKDVDFIEIDVQETGDGVIVLNHDVDLKRVAGVSREVTDLNYEEISGIDIGKQFSEEFKGEKIPTLEEVLKEVKGKAKLIIEIKPYGVGEDSAKKVVDLIKNYDMVEDCYIQSFDYEILKGVRKVDSRIKVGQIMYAAAGDLSSLDVDFYTVEQSMLSAGFVRNARQNEKEIWVWTVNSEKEIKEVLKYDIDGIITDYPERVQSLLKFNF